MKTKEESVYLKRARQAKARRRTLFMNPLFSVGGLFMMNEMTEENN